jgi:hypothetical protein
MNVKTQIVAIAVAAVLAGSAWMARAQTTDVQVGLIKADVNEDQALSKSEVLLNAMQGFVASDLDGDGLIEASEVGEEIATHAEFTDNDTDKGGSLTVEEVVEEKLADFKMIDKNGDGLLVIEELNAAYPPQE